VAARSFYESAGFSPVELRLVADVATLEHRLAPQPSPGKLKVQTRPEGRGEPT
jgi:hypothetical protein